MKKIILMSLMPLLVQAAAGPAGNEYANRIKKDAADLVAAFSKSDYRGFEQSRGQLDRQIKELERKMSEGILAKKLTQSDVRSVLGLIAKVRGSELEQAKKAKLSVAKLQELRKARGQEVSRVSQTLRNAFKNIGMDYVPSEEEAQPAELSETLFDVQTYNALGLAAGASAYEVLGVAPNASPEEIKKAWKKRTIEWHPDKHLGQEQLSNEVIKLINSAYDQLKEK